MEKVKNNIPRKLLNVTMGVALMISLSACAGNKNATGTLDSEKVYAETGNYKVTYGDLWNEFKWSADDQIDELKKVVVLNEQIAKITKVLKNDYASYKDDFEQDEYNELYKKYSNRIAEYVCQDVYDLDFDIDGFENYDESIEDLKVTEKSKLITKYCDEVFSTYGIKKIDSYTIEDLLKEDDAAKLKENYLTIAKTLSELYYPLLAKEIYAYDQIKKDAEEALEADEDDDDSKIGSYTHSQFITAFENNYTNKFDLGLVNIRFSTEDEYNNTLRAFGLKFYNKVLYYINETKTGMSYTEYCNMYDDISNPTNESNCLAIADNYSMVTYLELFIEIYNYIYGGYRDALPTSFPIATNATLNDLRNYTKSILGHYNSGDYKEEELQQAYEDLVNDLKTNYANSTIFSTKDIKEQSLTTYAYETLTLDKTKTTKKQYSTSCQSYNSAYYFMFKFYEGDNEYKDLYDSDMTDDEIMEMLLKDENKDLYNKLYEYLLVHDVTESKISSELSELTNDVVVKIYNEAMEISYSSSNSNYSKTFGKAPNENTAATLEYDGKVWKILVAQPDEYDDAAVTIAGTQTNYNLFNYFLTTSGPTTAIDILSKKIIKDTKAYEKTNEDRKDFEAYVENVLYYFANGYYESNGYSAEIGKYNFLMLYFHETDIDAIIDNYYRVQYASQNLLTDYSKSDVINFFKSYTDALYNNYFSLSGSRFLVYFDGDDDGNADDLTDWENKIVEFNGTSMKLVEVAKKLVYEVYVEISSSNNSHSTQLSTIVDEINKSARAKFDNNPILVENKWAEYRRVGLNAKLEDVSATNSDLDIDMAIKQRLLDYATKDEYHFYINSTTPTEFIESYIGNEDSVTSTSDNQILATKDGYNLLLITAGTQASSAKWTTTTNKEDLLNEMVIKYKDNYVTVGDQHNDDDALSYNQILLYVLEEAASGTNSLSPSAIADSLSNYLAPVLERYSNDSTQRVILLFFIEQNTNAKIFTNTNIFKESKDNESFMEIIAISQRNADSYVDYSQDTTGTANTYEQWWSKLETLASQFLLKEAE